jgi:hypothetical protein
MNYAFVTSLAVTPRDFVFDGSPNDPDVICNQLAQAASLPGTFVAWYSLDTHNAAAALGANHPRGWVRPDGKPFADTIDDLTSGRILYPLRLTEVGTDLGVTETLVATGTLANGETSPVACTGGSVGAGLADAGAGAWTERGTDPSQPLRGTRCDGGDSPHLYCFGIDHANPVHLLPRQTKLAFVSLSGYNVDPLKTTTDNLAAADQLCTSDAQSAGVTRVFRAALATQTASIAQRIGAGSWSRADGVELVVSRFEPTLIAPIDRGPAGELQAQVVLTGSMGSFVDVAGSNCADWTARMSSYWGFSARSSSYSVSVPVTRESCSNSNRIYCFEE